MLAVAALAVAAYAQPSHGSGAFQAAVLHVQMDLQEAAGAIVEDDGNRLSMVPATEATRTCGGFAPVETHCSNGFVPTYLKFHGFRFPPCGEGLQQPLDTGPCYTGIVESRVFDDEHQRVLRCSVLLVPRVGELEMSCMGLGVLPVWEFNQDCTSYMWTGRDPHDPSSIQGGTGNWRCFASFLG